MTLCRQAPLNTHEAKSDQLRGDVSHPTWMPSTSIWDMSLGKTIKASRAAQVNLSLDVLNVTNENSPNIIGFKPGDFGRVYSITAPRTYRAGVKLLF